LASRFVKKRTIERKNRMSLKKEEQRVLSFQVPVSVADAIETLARKEFSTLSTICRRAIARDLRAAGLLTERESA
jgi:hypothetical protein